MVRSSKFDFPNSAGDATLAARLDEPDGEARAYALFAHCFTCSKDILSASRIAGALAAQGIAVLRFDFTGLGHSEGEFGNTNFSSNIADLIAAAAHLRKVRRAPEIVIGHSLGGAAVLAAADAMPEAKAIATIGAPFDPSHVTHLFKERTAEIAEKGSAEVQLAGRTFTIQRQFLEDVAEQSLRAKIANLRRALLIFHAPRDQTVGIENAGWIFDAARHPKSFISLDTADHLLSQQKDAVYVGDVIRAWAGRYLETPAEAKAEPVLKAPARGVLVRELGTGHYTQQVTVRGHALLADEPASRGGQDKGPAPHELILAGLGTCAAMTLRMYAERKGWPLGPISVLTDIAMRPAAGGPAETRVSHIEKVISVEGDITDDQKVKLVEISDKSPMHRLLMAQGKIIASRMA